MTWVDVQALRKSGRFHEAVDLGVQALADGPDDFKLRTQIDWAFYGLVKNHVSSIVSTLKGGKPTSSTVVNQIHQSLLRYARQPKRRPDNARSNILRESKIAPHLPIFQGLFGGWALTPSVRKTGSTTSSMEIVSRRSLLESSVAWLNG